MDADVAQKITWLTNRVNELEAKVSTQDRKIAELIKAIRANAPKPPVRRLG